VLLHRPEWPYTFCSGGHFLDHDGGCAHHCAGDDEPVFRQLVEGPHLNCAPAFHRPLCHEAANIRVASAARADQGCAKRKIEEVLAGDQPAHAAPASELDRSSTAM